MRHNNRWGWDEDNVGAAKSAIPALREAAERLDKLYDDVIWADDGGTMGPEIKRMAYSLQAFSGVLAMKLSEVEPRSRRAFQPVLPTAGVQP